MNSQMRTLAARIMNLRRPPVDHEQVKKEKPGDTLKTIIIALVLALSMRSCGFELFSIPSGSMLPNLQIGDYVAVQKFSYGYSRYSLPAGIIPFRGRVFGSQPERGDIIVFRKPSNDSIDMVKRLVGLPGDRIAVRGGILFINGEPVRRTRTSDYLDEQGGLSWERIQYRERFPNDDSEHDIIEINGDNALTDNTREFIVPEEHFFFMGDSRDNSIDSRFLNDVGFVPFENLVGKVVTVLFSMRDNSPIWQVWNLPENFRLERVFDSVD